MQQLKVVSVVNIPDEYVLIEKVEYKQLMDNELVGVFWTMKDLEKRTGHRVEWLKENILYVPRLRDKLDVEKGGFVLYPRAKGQPWCFHARKMAMFLDDHFQEIFKQ